MPKPFKLPTLFNEALQISITKLKKWEYLDAEQMKRGTLTWSININKSGSISIQVNTKNEQPYIELDYKYRDEPRKYIVKLVTIHSNLGKGFIWYFLCPKTNKRCRKLYLIGGYFLHREAFRGCMYECQTRSKTWREWDTNYGSYFDLDRCYEEIYSKHFKKYYRGKPTKRYSKLKRKIEVCDRFSAIDIDRLFI